MSMCAGNMGNMSTCTVLLFEVGQLRGAVVVDVGASKRSGKKGQKQTTEKKMKGDKSGGGGPGNGEKRRREGEQEEGEFCLSSETMDTTGVQLRAYGRMSEDALKSSSSDRSVLF